MDMPSDAQRMDRIVRLVNEGFEDRITMSHDIHTKHRLVHFVCIPNQVLIFILISFFFLSQSQFGFGGHGYAHIYNNVLPKLATKGLTDKQIEKITVDNPAKWLQFDI